MEAPHAVWSVPRDWAPVLRRILVPIDFTSRSVHSLGAAVNLARRFPTAKCMVLHVDRHDTRCSGNEIGTSRLQELMAAYDEIMHAVDAAGVRFAPLFVKGQFIERAVARAASEHSADLVVLSTRGRSRLAGALHSSIAAQTLREVPGAILTLKPEGAALNWPNALTRTLEADGQSPFLINCVLKKDRPAEVCQNGKRLVILVGLAEPSIKPQRGLRPFASAICNRRGWPWHAACVILLSLAVRLPFLAARRDYPAYQSRGVSRPVSTLQRHPELRSEGHRSHT